MKKFKVTIIGNSIALRCRPDYTDSKNYGKLLAEKIEERSSNLECIVENTAFSRATVPDILKIFEDKIASLPADLVIINLGVCDASTREIPYWFAELVNKNDDSYIWHFSNYIHKNIFRKHIRFFVKLRGKKTWINSTDFERGYEYIISEIKKRSDALIVTLSINLPDQRIEGLLPGSHDKYLEYNQIIENIATRQQVSYISMDDLSSEQYYPDGSHYSALGHELVANRIIKVIKDNEERKK